jgi:hypothetical protein
MPGVPRNRCKGKFLVCFLSSCADQRDFEGPRGEPAAPGLANWQTH